MPMIATRQASFFVHALLDDRPFALGGDHETVEVELEAVGDGIVVDFRGELAGAYESGSVAIFSFEGYCGPAKNTRQEGSRLAKKEKRPTNSAILLIN